MTDRNNKDAQSQAGQNWLSTLHQARINCRERVATAMVEVPHPDRVRWPVRSGSQMGPAHKAAVQAHVSVIDYVDQIQPYETEHGLDEELWKEVVDTVELGDETMPISLANLNEWEFRFFTDRVVERTELEGETSRTEKYRVLLPTSGMRACYKQANRIVRELGFAADADAAGLPKGQLSTPEPRG